jgi:hypothetical protein
VEGFLGTEFFGVVRLVSAGGGGEGGFPERERLFRIGRKEIPCIQTKVTAEETAGLRVGIKGGDNGFTIAEGAVGGGAFTRAGVHVPGFRVGHGFGNLKFEI